MKVTKSKNISSQLDYYKELESKHLSRLLDNKFIKRKVYSSMKNDSKRIGFLTLLDSGYQEESKVRFSTFAMMYDFINTKHTSIEEFWFPTFDLAFAILSDHQELFVEINKRKRFFLKNKNNGLFVKNKALFEIAAGDWEGLNETFEHFESIFEDYNDEFLDKKHYFQIYKGFLEKDAKKIELGLNSLENEDLRKIRINHFTEEEYLSIMTIALSKLASMHGLGVEVNSNFVPEEMMKFNPLNEYPIQYSFLRNFYRDIGNDWRYDPVYPELQD
jgi:hypothetical protein